jgi:hypothetical protein
MERYIEVRHHHSQRCLGTHRKPVLTRRTATAIPAASLWSIRSSNIGTGAVLFQRAEPTPQWILSGRIVVFPYSTNESHLVLSRTTPRPPGPEGARNSPSTKLEPVERPPKNCSFRKSPGNRQEPNKSTLHLAEALVPEDGGVLEL